jgi:hypothetical protein
MSLNPEKLQISEQITVILQRIENLEISIETLEEDPKITENILFSQLKVRLEELLN